MGSCIDAAEILARTIADACPGGPGNCTNNPYTCRPCQRSVEGVERIHRYVRAVAEAVRDAVAGKVATRAQAADLDLDAIIASVPAPPRHPARRRHP